MKSDVDLESLLAVPRLGNAVISPNGKLIAWSWSSGVDTPDVYVTSLDGGSGTTRLSTTGERTVLRSWAPDNRSVVVAQDHGGDERVALWRVDLDDPGHLHRLTEESPPYFLYGGQIHPNNYWLVYAMNYDVSSNRSTEETVVYRHDMRTGERLPLACTCKPADCVPELNDTGTHILYTRQDLDPAGAQVWLVDINGDDDREILNFGADAKVYASWFPDSRRALFVAEIGGYRRVGIWSKNTFSYEWVIDDPRRLIEWAFVPRNAGNDSVVVVEGREARSYASSLDLTTGEEQSFSGQLGDLIPICRVNRCEWIGRYSSARHPADLIRFSRVPAQSSHDSMVSLTGMWDLVPFRPEHLQRSESIHWESVDGTRIQGWLYRPNGQPRGTIIHVHGGPTAHSEDDFDPRIQFFVSQGFNVLAPNYRGSTGFGLAFEESIKVDGWGGREQDDICTGIEALIARGIATAGQVGITGTSYGGYSSWCAVTRWPRDIIAAAAPICGMTDLVVDYETTRPDLRPYSEEMMGGSPQQRPERYRERSPVHFIKNIEGRLLIVQGARDPNVTPSNVDAVRAALDAAGVPYDVLVFEDEGHGIKRPANVAVLCRTLTAFFLDAFRQPFT